MSLTPGTRLGPYEIAAPLGAGGMGDVYRARDTRLGRDVAVKVLPPVFASDPERVRRFQQEARAVAALSHPHICQMFDVGADYLVLEYVDGVRPRGPLPESDAVRYALQIADALIAAHHRGILHLRHRQDDDGRPGRDRTVDGAVLGTAGYLALIYAGLGVRERVFEHLDKAIEERQPYLALLNTEPPFRGLHSDARFQKIVRRIGIPVKHEILSEVGHECSNRDPRHTCLFRRPGRTRAIATAGSGRRRRLAEAVEAPDHRKRTAHHGTSG